MDLRPKCKAYNNETLGRNAGQNLHDMGFGSDFLDRTPKAQVTKEKIDKLCFMKIFKNYALKDTIHRV